MHREAPPLKRSSRPADNQIGPGGTQEGRRGSIAKTHAPLGHNVH